ncbi:hypothetical protein TNCV_464551, partial [Trichonephila clavipes]
MSVLEALENYKDRCHPVVCKILDITSRLYSKGFDIVFFAPLRGSPSLGEYGFHAPEVPSDLFLLPRGLLSM